MCGKKTVVLVDGSYYLKRTITLFGNMVPSCAASLLDVIVRSHLVEEGTGEKNNLVRTYFYDCEPLIRKIVNPISKEIIDTGDNASTKWRVEYLECIKRQRQTMLRLGYIQGWDEWKIKAEPMARLMNKKLRTDELKGSDVTWVSRQKGVDVRIGMDMTRIALKGLAERIVLIAGDGDFVPVVDMAREEGIDVVLDPLDGLASRQLAESVDWIRTIPVEVIKARLEQERKQGIPNTNRHSPVAAHQNKGEVPAFMNGGTFT